MFQIATTNTNVRTHSAATDVDVAARSLVLGGQSPVASGNSAVAKAAVNPAVNVNQAVAPAYLPVAKPMSSSICVDSTIGMLGFTTDTTEGRWTKFATHRQRPKDFAL